MVNGMRAVISQPARYCTLTLAGTPLTWLHVGAYCLFTLTDLSTKQDLWAASYLSDSWCSAKPGEEHLLCWSLQEIISFWSLQHNELGQYRFVACWLNHADQSNCHPINHPWLLTAFVARNQCTGDGLVTNNRVVSPTEAVWSLIDCIAITCRWRYGGTSLHCATNSFSFIHCPQLTNEQYCILR